MRYNEFKKNFVAKKNNKLIRQYAKHQHSIKNSHLFHVTFIFDSNTLIFSTRGVLPTFSGSGYARRKTSVNPKLDNILSSTVNPIETRNNSTKTWSETRNKWKSFPDIIQLWKKYTKIIYNINLILYEEKLIYIDYLYSNL